MEEANEKKILLLDFDGVIHSYSSGWKGATEIPDPPVEGAFEFIEEAVKHFKVCILSARSKEPGGIEAMKKWFFEYKLPIPLSWLEFPTEKPNIHFSIDDRGYQFRGSFPSIKEIKDFKPWWKK
jgi:hypothetical protein